MTARLRFLLAAILFLLFCVDFVWGTVGRFDIDYGKLRYIGLFSLLPLSVGALYTIWRPDKGLASVMFSVAFLLLFAPLCTLLNYLAISVAGARIDDVLASYDRTMGIDWPHFIMLFASYPLALSLLGIAYKVTAFQVAVAIALLGYKSDVRGISLVCIATTVCALATIAFWTMLPSFGAYTVYDLSAVGRKSGIIVDRTYPDFLVWVLAHGPGRIDVLNAKGLIGFPSFHTQEVIIAWWYLRKQRWLFVLLSLFSLIALVSIPVQGGHHIIDVIGGIGFAALGIWSASKILPMLEEKTACARPENSSPVPDVID